MSCDFVPPYLLRRLASEESIVAVGSGNTLRLDEELRSRRARASGRTPVTASPDAARIIYTAHNTEELPGDVARRDADPATGDAAVDEAFDATGVVWDLFAERFGRQSYDGQGSTVTVTVHYGTNYDNAFWDGGQLVFGDGDGEIFDRFTKPMDVLAHEFSHGVVQYTAGLNYEGQPGALNESVADVFASMAKQQALGQTAEQADWLVGEGLFLPGIEAKALRSMIEPGTAYDDPRLGKDLQVANMADYVDTDEDNGGVHINSGIPNRAFALSARTLGGASWERAGRVWYDALTAGEVGADADFAAFAEATIRSADQLFAGDSAVAQAISQAWTTVGVLSAASTVGSPESPDRGAVGPPQSPAFRVAVRRTGGFAGTVKSGELDLGSAPEGSEVQTLLGRVDFRSLANREAVPDRFVYTLEYGTERVTVPEHDLTPELARVVQIVLGTAAPPLS